MKPGIKTTEFWVTAAIVVASVLGWASGHLPGAWAAGINALSAGIYAAARSYTKARASDEQLRQQVIEKVLENVGPGDVRHLVLQLRDGDDPGRNGHAGDAGRPEN